MPKSLEGGAAILNGEDSPEIKANEEEFGDGDVEIEKPFDENQKADLDLGVVEENKTERTEEVPETVTIQRNNGALETDWRVIKIWEDKDVQVRKTDKTSGEILEKVIPFEEFKNLNPNYKPKETEGETASEVAEEGMRRKYPRTEKTKKDHVRSGAEFDISDEEAKKFEEKFMAEKNEASQDKQEKTAGQSAISEKDMEEMLRALEKMTSESLGNARQEFVKSENEYAKYRVWTGDISKIFKNKERKEAQTKYETAREKYNEVRAEQVMDKAEKFVEERAKLADQRAEKYEKSAWRKSWDWLGQQNLEKLGWHAKSRFGKILAKGINLRTGISLGLLGTGIGFGMGSAVGAGAFLARRAYGGVATGSGSYELLRMGMTKYEKFSEKKLSSLDLAEAEKLMASYEIKAKLRGDKVSGNEDYQKLQGKYLDLIEKNKDAATDKGEEMMKVIAKKSDQQLAKISRNAKIADTTLKVIAAGAGTFVGTYGLGKIINKLYGYHGAGITGGGKENLLSKSNMAAGGSEMPAAVAQETATPQMPNEFTFSVQANEGYIHEARKAIAQYIHESGQPDLEKLTPAQRVWAEDKLWQLYQQGNPDAAKTMLHVGNEVQFKCDQVEQVLNEVQQKFGAPEKLTKLSANLKDFSDNVKWSRYDLVDHPTGGKVYAWELDDGIKAVDWHKEVMEPLVKNPEIQVINLPEAENINHLSQPLTNEMMQRTADSGANVDMLKDVTDQVTYSRVCHEFNLSTSEYGTIKDLKVKDFVENFKWGKPPRMYDKSVDWWEFHREDKLRDKIVDSFSGWRTAAKDNLSVQEYIKRYLYHWGNPVE